jgi:propionyl-CoA carboxylase beta chain
MSARPQLDLFEERREAASRVDPVRAAAQHARGKLTARERIALLLDPGSFAELDRFVTSRTGEPGFGEGVVTGHGRVDGRMVCVYAQDFTVRGGTLSEAHAARICKVMELALRVGVPIVGVLDSGGGRIQEGVEALRGYSDIFLRNTRASGVVPQISAVVGPCAGGAAYSPAITDFVHMVRGIGYMFVTGPGVVRRVAHEDATMAQLGGASLHATCTGVAHHAHATEEECFASIRRLLGFLPANHAELPPAAPATDPPDRADDSLLDLVPAGPDRPYDMRTLLRAVVDDGDFYELHAEFAPNLLVGFARMGGRPVGIVANQPLVLAGALDVDASVKGARFVRFCDRFNLPVVTFEDVPGFLPGVSQERGGIIRHGAKLLFAYCEAAVPKVTVIVRKAYGGGYAAMGPRHTGGDFCLAWPTAEIAVMGAAGAAEILFRRQADSSPDPATALREQEREYRDNWLHPYAAASRGYVDDVIDPRETRPRLISALDSLLYKRVPGTFRQQGNIPL